ncbi:MAG: hypothetical protein AAFR38_08785 [Planctomycetota bacterium]
MDGAPPILQVLFGLVFVVGAIAAGIYAHQQEKKRTAALLEFARIRGFTLSPSSGPEPFHAHFEIFRRGFDRRALNTITGSIDVNGRPFGITTGDFRYRERRGSGKNRRTVTIKFSYLVAQLPFMHIPDTRVRREHWGDKLASVFGADDIDFESERFSRDFHVKCDSKRFAFDLIDPRMMEFLMASDPPNFEIERGRLLIHTGAGRWKPGQFARQLSWLDDFGEHWPDHLVRKLEEGVEIYA